MNQPFHADTHSRQTADDGPPTDPYRAYAAPRGHGTVVMESSRGELADVWREAQRFQSETEFVLGPLRRRSRGRLIHDAIHYTSAYRDVPTIDCQQPLVMAGHQPTLFHPGVWFKNYALSQWAHRCGATAINLVIDNDVAGVPAVKIPAWDRLAGALHPKTLAFDDGHGGIPYEQSAIRNRDRFESFATEVASATRGWIDDPIVNQLWPHAIAATQRCDVAACALAQARHGLEAQMNWQTLELPLSVAVRGEAFASFVITLLQRARHFAIIYNEAAQRYRAAHGIRSKAHPVPNLTVTPQWVECPLWVYGDDTPRRRPVFLRSMGTRVQLLDGDAVLMDLNLSDHDSAVATWCESLGPNCKIRPRALLTTMYARWVLSDVFMHGIGGGKYDQLGDDIAFRFFGFTPPPYIVTSATVRLPGFEDASLADETAALKQQLRDLRFQPERLSVGWDSRQRSWVDQKNELIANRGDVQDLAAWHRRVTAINRQLTGSLERLESSLQQRLARARGNQNQLRWLAGREHSFCVFPLEFLARTFADMFPVDEGLKTGSGRAD
ncbi:MAG: hypothetical protein AAF958_11295 [Planctomycetota bacterium]